MRVLAYRPAVEQLESLLGGIGRKAGRASIGAVVLWLLGAVAAVAQPTAAVPKAAIVDTVSHDDSHRLEIAYTTLSGISGQVRDVFDTREVAEELPGLDENLHAIRHSVEETGQVVDIKQLQMCQLMLANIQEQLAEWRTALGQAHEQLETMQARLASLAPRPARVARPDAAVLALERADSALQGRRNRIGGLLTKRYERTKQLQTQVAASYIQTLELQDEVGDQMRHFGRTTIKAAYPPLWAARPAPASNAAPDAAHDAADRREIINFYFANNWDNWAYMVLIGLVFYGWVAFNYRRVRARTLDLEMPFRYLRPGPVAATAVVVFSLAPVLELHPPPVYLALLQALLLLALTAVFARSWSRQLFRYWLVLVVFFVIMTFTNANAATGLGARWGLLLLNVLAAGLGGLLLLRLRETMALLRFLIPVTWLFIGLNALAVVCNVFGRLSLAKMFSTAAIFGLTQGIGLAVFVELFTEAFHLQILGIRSANGGAATFDFDKIETHLLRLLTGVAAVVWLVVFTSNLNLHATLYRALEQVLTAPHTLGSTEFTLGNILLFFFILFVSAQLQQYLGYFFGDVGEADSVGSRQRGSWLVALRLLLVLVGFALATAATGLPLSKIAIVFGALSVGIGLGLQSIVNNLVSGIILIFERPFHVGDFIEVAGKSGRVQDIGIRSSKLTSVTGSEIILPNGDLLSQHVINWTRTNDHIRVDLVLKLAPGVDLQTDLQTARELIQEEIKNSPYTMQSLPPEILLSSINGQVYELKVLFWITNIRQEQLTKSEILAGIYRRFTAQGLQLN
ncbi:mechanosensitive ion channel [Hymenobacter sp. BT770]|uniref:mechanosensitive ion channel domain-containing protein n=1 Tax=Hymenobacter sp. BT770 TaxID=2886942 RepID=UPI001D10D176|nr:mechanosensitive ion channel domain-containing protein [Hymenobacter sp. BT770]MCC3154469.1 mechanosensitive ion channel [Hymenobacter sp. BT770]MDO3416466.1 mechanosensitive ion channel [Hymenobacter sp. BT770]